ncbi:MAG: peptidase prolyl oligopeptidase [Verrucomicrobia bacterium]|nr:peptidase prolyl oligopeptidase [Verrucomicrobiota bacterium]
MFTLPRPKSLALFLVLLSALAAAGGATEIPRPLPLDVFFGGNTIFRPSLSPTGRYLAWLQPANNRLNLVVLDRESGKKTRLTDMKQENVVAFEWAGPDRLFFYQEYKGQESFGTYAVNADGSQLVVLHQATQREGDRLENADTRSYGVIDTLPDDPKHILVDILRGASGLGDPNLLDIYTGKTRKLMNNLGKVRDWITDRRGVIRIAIANDEFEEFASVFYRADENAPWREIEKFPTDGPTWFPLGFDGDNHTLFVRSNRGRATQALYAFDPDTGKTLREVLADPVYDAGGIIYSRHLKKVVGVHIDREYPEIRWLDDSFAQLQRDIDAALPGTTNRIASSTDDGSVVVIHAGSDRDPGTYYLLDTRKLELQRLARITDEVDPALMAEMKPIAFTARDGLLIHGYLTLPVGREPKNMPLIINPHGGPFGIRDSWGYNPEIQFLANRGYAVLQVNYRGSGGYGHAFEEAGYLQWGLKMQDDLTDAVHWAVKQGFADDQRVAIYGASYGGYAALAGVTLTPDLYCCAVNYVGVADITRLSIIQNFSRFTAPGQKFIARRWGHPRHDAAQLAATSPINLVQKIHVPLLMAYGRYDPRVTYDQYMLLEEQLNKHHVFFKNIVIGNEGHGFNKYENRIGFYREMDDFFSRFLPSEVREGRVEVKDPTLTEMPAKGKP